MPYAFLPDLRLHYLDHGPKDGPVLVLCHALGLNLSIWDAVIPLLPASLRVIRYDHRGHGASDTPPAPYSMGALVRDAERLLDHLAVRDCVVLGLSMGGLVAQGLAVKRLDLVRAMILSNTAVKIGFDAHWQAQIDAVREQGLVPGLDATMQRLFSRAFLAGDQSAHWRQVLESGNAEGYIGCAAAVAGTDFYTPTASLTLPTLAIASSNDAITPPDMVRETADLILGSQFALIRGPGHLPCIEMPQTYAELISNFLRRIGHL
jgi:3-oxoadipate enol-lactonase